MHVIWKDLTNKQFLKQQKHALTMLFLKLLSIAVCEIQIFQQNSVSDLAHLEKLKRKRMVSQYLIHIEHCSFQEQVGPLAVERKKNILLL